MPRPTAPQEGAITPRWCAPAAGTAGSVLDRPIQVRGNLVDALNGSVQDACPASRPLKRESAVLARAKRPGEAARRGVPTAKHRKGHAGMMRGRPPTEPGGNAGRRGCRGTRSEAAFGHHAKKKAMPNTT